MEAMSNAPYHPALQGKPSFSQISKPIPNNERKPKQDIEVQSDFRNQLK